MMSDIASRQQFRAPYAPDDRGIAARVLETAGLSTAQEERIDRVATRLIDTIRLWFA